MRCERHIRPVNRFNVKSDRRLGRGAEGSQFNLACEGVETEEEVGEGLQQRVVIGEAHRVVPLVVLPQLRVEGEAPKGEVEGSEYITQILVETHGFCGGSWNVHDCLEGRGRYIEHFSLII